MEKLKLRINAKECVGCHACEIACKQEHGLGVGPRLIRVIDRSPFFVPVYCRHCARPPCKDVCPTAAISRDERGIVLIDKELCIGCGDCVDACPFGAMQFDPDQEVALNCDMCIDRIEEGKQPACVLACPTHCICLVGTKTGLSQMIEKRLIEEEQGKEG